MPRRPVENGAARRAEGQNRTGDTSIFSAVLYRLSYLGAESMLFAAERGCQANPATGVIREVRGWGGERPATRVG